METRESTYDHKTRQWIHPDKTKIYVGDVISVRRKGSEREWTTGQIVIEVGKTSLTTRDGWEHEFSKWEFKHGY